MASVSTGRQPVLFRAGDIGVSSDWRDLTSDWAPLITGTGVLIYSALRDYYEKQRALRPFLLDPHGPTKRYIQHLIGRKTSHSLRGPEYLLATIGLLHVEIVRGGSDELRPNHTAVAYYVVGALSRPELSWSTVDHVLDAIMPGLGEPMGSDEQRAQTRQAAAAMRALEQAGMLSNEDPEHVFNPDGAWVGLLPQLIQDARWEALFRRLHGAEALEAYRRGARAWVGYALRRAAALRELNDANADLLLAASRRGRGGSSAASSTGTTPQIVLAAHTRGPGAPGNVPADDVPADDVPADDVPADDGHATARDGAPGTVLSTDLKGISLNQTPFNVQGDNSECPKGISLNQTPSGTDRDLAHPDALDGDLSQAPHVSQSRNQNQREREGNQETPDPAGTLLAGTDGGAIAAPARPSRRREQPLDLALAVEPFLRDTELYSASLDSYFWTMVGEIVQGTPHTRYAYTAAERKALQRMQAQGSVSIGVLLACLRALRTLPDLAGVTTLHAFLKHAAWAPTLVLARQVVAAMDGTPAAGVPTAPKRGWELFLEEFRRMGSGGQLRNVRVADVQLLAALFARMPEACWEVLDRVQRCATPVQLSYAYLDAAIKRNLREQAERALAPARPTAADCRSAAPPSSAALGPAVPASPAGVAPGEDDPRVALLAREDLPASLLTAELTLEYLAAWVRFVDQNRGRIRSRRAYLLRVLPGGLWPERQTGAAPTVRDHQPALASTPAAAAEPAGGDEPGASPGGRVDPALWARVLTVLKAQLRPSEYDTWLVGTELVDVTEDAAVVAVPNVFARQTLETEFQPQIAAALGATLKRPVAVTVVLGG